MFQHDLGEGASLKLFEEYHAPALFALIEEDRAHLREWLPWLDANTRVEDSLAFIRMTREQFAANHGFQAGIWQDKTLLGVVGFNQLSWPNRWASMGYWLAEKAQGRGLMTRSVAALVDHALGPLGINRVEIRAAAQNLRSRAVIERLGFAQEGLIRDAEWLYDHYVDHVVYGMLARDWWPEQP